MILGFLPAMLVHSRPLKEFNLIFLPPCEGWHPYTVSPPQLWNVGTGFFNVFSSCIGRRDEFQRAYLMPNIMPKGRVRSSEHSNPLYKGSFIIHPRVFYAVTSLLSVHCTVFADLINWKTNIGTRQACGADPDQHKSAF